MFEFSMAYKHRKTAFKLKSFFSSAHLCNSHKAEYEYGTWLYWHLVAYVIYDYNASVKDNSSVMDYKEYTFVVYIKI